MLCILIPNYSISSQNAVIFVVDWNLYMYARHLEGWISANIAIFEDVVVSIVKRWFPRITSWQKHVITFFMTNTNCSIQLI